MNLTKWNLQTFELNELHRSLSLLGITARSLCRFRELLSSIITF